MTGPATSQKPHNGQRGHALSAAGLSDNADDLALIHMKAYMIHADGASRNRPSNAVVRFFTSSKCDICIPFLSALRKADLSWS